MTWWDSLRQALRLSPKPAPKPKRKRIRKYQDKMLRSEAYEQKTVDQHKPSSSDT